MNVHDDQTWMRHAIELAQEGIYTARPNPRVGCVIVKNNQIIGRGWHAVHGEAHAEVHALREAGDNAQDATCYVTLAPCTHMGKTPPCADALIKAGIRRVVVATADPNPLLVRDTEKTLQAAGIEYLTGICELEARAINPGFLMRLQAGRPFVRLKIGMSLDGKTALPTGESQWITCEASRARVQQIRARSCVVVTGIGTVLRDDPQLNVRDETIVHLHGFRQPLRVVLDSQLRFPLQAKMLALPGKIIIFTVRDDKTKMQVLQDKGVDVYVCPEHEGQVDVHSVLKKLAQLHVNEVMLEAGAILNGAFIGANVVDEYHAFIAPYIIGDPARGMCELNLLHLKDKRRVQIVHQETVGVDQYLIFR